jgi:hypothetical protein
MEAVARVNPVTLAGFASTDPLTAFRALFGTSPRCLGNCFACARALKVHSIFNALLRIRILHGACPVTIAAMLALVPVFFGMGFGVAADLPRVRSIVIEDQLIIRVPVRPEPPPDIQWVERKGPKCIHSNEIRGAFLSASDHVDFLRSGRRLFRAELDESCPALDFYAGFYLTSDDGKICVRRDSIRSRMGGTCGIEKFRRLVPKQR